MTDRPHPDLADIRMEKLLQALADPTRMRILDMLDRNGETACPVAYAHLGVSRATGSHHFRILREAGAICARMHGRDLHTQIRRTDLETLFPGFLKAVLDGWRRDQPQSHPEEKSPPADVQA